MARHQLTLEEKAGTVKEWHRLITSGLSKTDAAKKLGHPMSTLFGWNDTVNPRKTKKRKYVRHTKTSEQPIVVQLEKDTPHSAILRILRSQLTHMEQTISALETL